MQNRRRRLCNICARLEAAATSSLFHPRPCPQWRRRHGWMYLNRIQRQFRSVVNTPAMLYCQTSFRTLNCKCIPVAMLLQEDLPRPFIDNECRPGDLKLIIMHTWFKYVKQFMSYLLTNSALGMQRWVTIKLLSLSSFPLRSSRFSMVWWKDKRMDRSRRLCTEKKYTHKIIFVSIPTTRSKQNVWSRDAYYLK